MLIVDPATPITREEYERGTDNVSAGRTDGKRTPLDGRQLRRYIASMREVVEAYKKTMLEMNYCLRRRSGAAARHLTSSNLPQRGNNSIIYLYIIIIIYKLNIRYLVRIDFTK